MLILPATIFALILGNEPPLGIPVHFECSGLEAYDVSGNLDVDWVWGSIRARPSGRSIAFTMGLVNELVPVDRPAGFRSYNVEKLGSATLRYGVNVKQKQIQATLTGAPLDMHVNLAAPIKQQKELLSIARVLSSAPCKATR